MWSIWSLTVTLALGLVAAAPDVAAAGGLATVAAESGAAAIGSGVTLSVTVDVEAWPEASVTV